MYMLTKNGEESFKGDILKNSGKLRVRLWELNNVLCTILRGTVSTLVNKNNKDILLSSMLLKYSVYNNYSILNFSFFLWMASKKENLLLFSSFFYFILYTKPKYSESSLAERTDKKAFILKTAFSEYSLVFYSFLSWLWPHFKFRYTLHFDYTLQTTFFNLRTKFPFVFLVESLFGVRVKLTSPLPLVLTIKSTDSFLIKEKAALFVLSYYKSF